MTEVSPFSAEALVQHARGLRALARALVRDAHLADDLVQTTWLRALQARPAAGGPAGNGPMPWLARVLRNEARSARRTARRQRARVDRLDPGEPSPPAADVAERIAVQRAVLEAVDSLSDAQREVVYLRWFDELPPRVIAQRLGLSRRAVESRLRRALEQLRSRLDAQRPGGRASWVAPLSAVAWPRSVSTSLIAGAVALQMKIVIAVLVLGLGVLLWMWSQAPQPAEADGTWRAESEAAALHGAPEPEATAPGRRPVRAAVPEMPATPAGPGPLELLRGTVLDAGGRAVGGLAVRFVPDPRYGAENAPRGAPSGDSLTAVSAADGTFAMTDPKQHGEIECEEPGWTTVLSAERDFRGEPVVVVVARRRSVSGTVRLPDGSPVAGASVELELPAALRARFDVPLDHSKDREWRTAADELGRFVFSAPPALADCEVRATAQGYADASVEIDALDHPDLALVMYPLAEEQGMLRGIVVDAAGMPVAGAHVALGRTPTTTAEDGSFKFVLGDPEGEARLFAVARGWRPAVVERSGQPGGDWPEFVQVQLVDRPLAIEGTVLRADGEPHDNASVWVDDPTYFAANAERAFSAEHVMHEDELLWRRFDTDEAGRFRIEGLLDREYEVRAIEKGTTAIVVVSGVRAGSDVVLRFLPGSLHERIEGRVVDSAGAPVEGVAVTVSRAAFVFGAPGSQQWLCEERGARAVSDAEGRVVLENVPRRGIDLELGGADLMTHDFEFEGHVVTTPFEIVVTRRCGLRIDVSGTRLAEAELARVLDAAGEPLKIQRDEASTRYIERQTAVANGRTEVIYVPDTARTVVLIANGRELGRLPTRPEPGEITVVRP